MSSSSINKLRGKIRVGCRKKAMRREKFKRIMNESNLITIMEEEGETIFR